MTKITDAEIKKCLRRVIAQFPEPFRASELANLDRYAFNVRLVLKPGAHLIDLGCGTGAFPLVCAELGMRVTVIDEWLDPVHLTRDGQTILHLYEQHGIETIRADLLSFTFPQAWQGMVNVVSCFESMEHWHDSPRNLFRQVAQALKPGGKLVLSAPNAVAAHNRLLVLLGRTNYHPWTDFYNGHVPFQGHVREPVVAELRSIAEDLGLTKVQIRGKYWLAQRMPGSLSLLARLADRLFEQFPPLCGMLYLVAEKPVEDHGHDV